METNQPTQCIKCNRPKRLDRKGLCAKCYKLEHFKLVICSRCQEVKPYHSRQMCEYCYKAWHKEQNKDSYQSKAKIYQAANKEKQQEYNKTYYLNNQGKILEAVRKYRQDNLEKVHEYDKTRHSTDIFKANKKIYIEANRLHIREIGARTRREKPEIHRRQKHLRRARIYNLPRTLTEQEWQNILQEHNYSCAYCGIKPAVIHREHKVPLSRGGGYTAENIVPACPTCNHRKQSKTDVEFREYLKKYPRVSDKQSAHT